MVNKLINILALRLPNKKITNDLNFSNKFWIYMGSNIEKLLNLEYYYFEEYTFGKYGFDYVFRNDNSSEFIYLSIDFINDLIGEDKYNELCDNFMKSYNF